MNKTDQTHATFLNCLRDWSDPYLHGQKQIKTINCNRCENCGCRMLHDLIAKDASTNLNATASSHHTLTATNTSDSNSIKSLESLHCSQHEFNAHHHTSLTKLNSKPHHHHTTIKHTQHRRNNGLMLLSRSKSSVNVPKTIDQCIKLAKSRPRPSSIRPYATPRSGLLINEAASTPFKRQSSSSLKSKSKLVVHDTLAITSAANTSSYSTDEKETNKLKQTCTGLNAQVNTLATDEYFLQVKLDKQHENSLVSYSSSSSSTSSSSKSSANLNKQDESKLTCKKLADSTSLCTSSNSLSNDQQNSNENFDDSLQDKSFDSDR